MSKSVLFSIPALMAFSGCSLVIIVVRIARVWYSCFFLILNTVFISFARPSWTEDKHLAFFFLPPKLHCALWSYSNPLGPIRMPAEPGSA